MVCGAIRLFLRPIASRSLCRVCDRILLHRLPPLSYTTFRTETLRKFTSRAVSLQDALNVSDKTVAFGFKEREDGSAQLQNSPISALRACPGCGALAQVIEPAEPGFYSVKRKAVREYLDFQSSNGAQALKPNDDSIFESAIRRASPELVKAGVTGQDVRTESRSATSQVPLCDRCHMLVHHQAGSPVIHPTLDSIKETILQSPWQQNHIYHVVDAADFPMSFIPRIHRGLSLAPPRSKNRRATHAGYRHGKKTELSYIITRSDLLAPKKEQVDRMMPYFVDVLREALGKTGENVRLGNVRCVSSKRGWWTRDLKEIIWKRGGAGWMVGKVNVGKSNLFQVVFPKGRMKDASETKILPIPMDTDQEQATKEARDPIQADNEGSLLPPAQAETQHPTMPTVSALPGTTASPIRVPFGNGKGELIDLPGLERSKIANFVRPERQAELVMDSPLRPKQETLKPNETLLLGGLVRVKVLYNNRTSFLVHNYTTLKARPYSEEEFERVIQGDMKPPSGITADPELWKYLRSAGRFPLRFDVTKQRAGPLTRRDAVGLRPKDLPFTVLAVDILIEGLGWVEIVAQVRRKDLGEEDPGGVGTADRADPSNIPIVEVFSPKGEFISYRRPMNASLLLRK